MPTNYSPPDVEVEQIQKTVQTQRIPPVLSVVVVGPSRAILAREAAGTFEAGVAFDAAMPKLPDGATVREASVEVLLDAKLADGTPLGLFKLTAGTDYQLSTDLSRLLINSDMALEYSILSARNNDQPNNTTNDDRGAGTPDAVLFTDTAIDFMGRNADADGTTFVIIDSPAAIAGTYRVYELVPTVQSDGSAVVYTLKVEKVDAAHQPEVDKTVTVDHLHVPATRFIYGFPATHELAASQTNNITAGTIGQGIGIKATPAQALATDAGRIFSPGTITIPSSGSGDAVWFTPPAASVPGNDTGSENAAWRAIVAAAQPGHWLRITSVFGGGSSEIRDYKVLAVDTALYRLNIQNPDEAGTGTVALASATQLDLIEVLRGSADDVNAAGDCVTGTVNGATFEREILSARPGFLELVALPPSFSSSVDTTVRVRRGVPYRNVAAGYDLVKRVESTGTDSPFSGTVLVSYQADRTDLALNGMIEIGSQDDITNNLGMIHPDNPLAMHCDIVLRTGLADGRRVFFALSIPSDTLDGYQSALEVAESNEGYFFVPCTQDKAIIALFASHVTVQSQPENKHERRVYASTKIVTSDQVLPATGTTWPTGSVDALDASLFTAPAADLGEVKAGQMLILLASSAADAVVVAKRRIQSVNSATKELTLLNGFDALQLGNTYSFRVETYPYNKVQQAEEWRDYAKSLNNKRVSIIRPDQVVITYTDKTGLSPVDRQITVPASYLCAAYAGLRGSVRPQQPLTNVGIPGIDRVIHSSEYFTPAQLNTIAEGGNNIVVQTTKGSVPYSRQQLTTCMRTLQEQEESIVVLIDFAAKFFRNTLRPFIGNHNIETEYLTQLRGVCEAIIRALVQAKVLLQGTTLDSLMQDPDEMTAVITEVSMKVPYPCNKIKVKLYS